MIYLTVSVCPWLHAMNTSILSTILLVLWLRVSLKLALHKKISTAFWQTFVTYTWSRPTRFKAYSSTYKTKWCAESTDLRKKSILQERRISHKQNVNIPASYRPPPPFGDARQLRKCYFRSEKFVYLLTRLNQGSAIMTIVAQWFTQHFINN